MSDCTGTEMNRRDFVAAAGVAAAVGLVVLDGLETASAQEAAPPATQPASNGPIDCGPKANFAKTGPVMTWAKKPHHFIVINENGKLYAPTSRCTHRRCDISDAGDHFLCHCHHSDFKYDGTVIDGPAHQPLARYGISLNDSGNVVVDMTQQFPKDQWTDPKSFIDMSAA